MNIPFTADMARKLAGATVQDKVDLLLVTIKELATNKQRRCRTGYDHKADEDLWINGGYSTTRDWKEAKDLFTELGYKVTFYYNEGSMAVDMYTLVEW